MDEKEQIKPLTSTTSNHQAINVEEKAATSTTTRPSSLLQDSCSKCFIARFCGCCSAVVAILGLITLVLTFTVFKTKNPVLALNAIYVKNVNILLSTPTHPISFNATLTADISIENPSVASLQFDSGTTKLCYMDETVGWAYSPRTKISAHRTARMNITVDVLADQVAMIANATGSVLTHGYLNLTSSTDVRGRVSMMGIFDRNIEVAMNCSMSLDVPLQSQQVKYKVCEAYVM